MKKAKVETLLASFTA